MSFRDAAKKWQIPKSTIARRYHGAKSGQDRAQAQQILDPESESRVAKWINDQALAGFGLTQPEIRDYVSQLIGKRVGINWVRRFLQRNDEVRMVLGQKMDYKRRFRPLERYGPDGWQRIES